MGVTTPCLKDLESKVDQPATPDLTQRMKKKLDTLDSEFKTHHYALIDLIDDEETLQKEQDVLDEHDDDVTVHAVRIQQLLTNCASSSDSSSRKIASRRFAHLQKNLSSVSAAIGSLSGESDDVCLLCQYEEQLGDFEKELGDIRNSLLSLDLKESDELCTSQTNLEKGIFDCSLEIKKLLHASSHAHDPAATPPDGKGVKLPRLDSRSNLSDSEKLVYLQQSLKDGSVKNVIEGLSCSGEYYTEAIECLQSRYDRPTSHPSNSCLHDPRSPCIQGW